MNVCIFAGTENRNINVDNWVHGTLGTHLIQTWKKEEKGGVSGLPIQYHYPNLTVQVLPEVLGVHLLSEKTSPHIWRVSLFTYSHSLPMWDGSSAWSACHVLVPLVGQHSQTWKLLWIKFHVWRNTTCFKDFCSHFAYCMHIWTSEPVWTECFHAAVPKCTPGPSSSPARSRQRVREWPVPLLLQRAVYVAYANWSCDCSPLVRFN